MHHAFLYISLPSLYDYDLKMPNFTFCRGREQKTTTFFFFSRTSIQYFRILLDDSIWRIERDGTSAIIKFEVAQIHFFKWRFRSRPRSLLSIEAPNCFFFVINIGVTSVALCISLFVDVTSLTTRHLGIHCLNFHQDQHFHPLKLKEKQDNQLFTCRHYNRLQPGIAQQ